MSTGFFTFGGQDLGALYGLILERRRVALIPQTRDRLIMVPGRPGSHDFGSDLGERQIELECFFNQTTRAALMTALQGVAQAMDPSTEIVTGDKAFKQLIFDDLSDRYYLAKITGMPTPEIIVTTGKVTFTMRCSDPFAYSTAQYVVSGGQATITGFSAYRQAPEKIAWNLVKDGAISVGATYWTDSGGATWQVIVDGTSPSGSAYRLISAGASPYRYQNIPCEAGKVYSAAAWIRSDGTVAAFLDMVWLDAGGNFISENTSSANATAAWVEETIVNKTAPGNARTMQVRIYGGVAGISFYAGVRVMQQTAAPAAWVTATHQQTLTQKGLEIYEAGTNSAADGDMEAVGTASYAATLATLTKETGAGLFFAGAKSLKVASTGTNGRANQTGALAAGQPITASVRVKGGDANCRLILTSTPSEVTIVADQFNPNTTDWNTLRVSGVIPGGDTGWHVYLIAGSNTAVAYFDNLAVENKAYDTMNADPSGQAFALASRTISNATVPVPAGFDQTDFSAVVVFRLDHAVAATPSFRDAIGFVVGSGDSLKLAANYVGNIFWMKERAAGVGQSNIADSTATNALAGDTVAVGMRFSTTAGLKMWIAKNGSAVASYSIATPEALLPIVGTVASIYLGTTVPSAINGAGMLDGTLGVVRIMKAGLTDAQIAAIVAAPYAQQDETIELAVWRFEGAAVPEDYASGTLSLEVGGTYRVDPTIDITAGVAFGPGTLTVTDSYGSVFSWTGSLSIADVLSIESATLRVRKNGTLSMSGVVAGSKWPRFRGGGVRDSIVVAGIPASSIRALTATYRTRWI